MGFKYTKDEIRRYVEESGEELLSDDFLYATDKLKLKCKNGHEYEMAFNRFKMGRRCRQCHDEQSRISIDDVKLYLTNNHPGYSIIEETYIKASEKSEFICDKGHHFKTQFSDIKKGHLCPICFKYNKELTSEKAKEIFMEDGYSMIGKYKNQTTKVLLKCPEGHNINISMIKFKLGVRCKYCSHQSEKYTQEFVNNYFNQRGYRLLDEYVGKDSKLNLICPYGHDIQMSFSAFKNAKCRCPKCRCSNGESEIIYLLDKNNVNYKFQKTFMDCKDIDCLPFDFYINDMNICIEFDGEQHYVPCKKFGGEETFQLLKKHDEIKNQYCQNNGIKLLRIPYWDFENIEQILKDAQIIN